MNTYKVICGVCKSESDIKIDDYDRIDWLKTNRVISGRKRLDGQWGWQCMCGNNDIMTEQEKKTIRNWAQPEPSELETIIKSLKMQKPKFIMETI